MKNDLPIVFVNVPSTYNVDPRAQEALMKAAGREDFDFQKPANYLNDLAKTDRMPFIDLSTVARNDPKNFYFSGDGHWSPVGVNRSADYILKALALMKLIPSAS